MLRLMAFIMLAGISWNQAVILFYLNDLLARETGWRSICLLRIVHFVRILGL